ncbi:beta strand repeat-containing protein [Spirosoma litoris]
MNSSLLLFHRLSFRTSFLLIILTSFSLLTRGKTIEYPTTNTTAFFSADSGRVGQKSSYEETPKLLPDSWMASAGLKLMPPDGANSFEIEGGERKISKFSTSLRAAPLSTLDYQPMMDLYNGTNGPNWTNHTGWGNGTDPCTGNNGNPWFGLTCTNGRVSEIALTNNNLVGSLPGSLSMLTGLTVLQINQNSQLSGSIPTGLGNLTALIGIELDNNDLTGPIPTDLSTLTNLQALSLPYNRLTGSIPANLPTNLKMLDLEHNQLTGSLPANLITMTNIQYIILSVNQLTGTVPTDLSPLTSLLNFNVSENQLTGNIPTILPASLQGYELQNNQLTGSIPANLPSNIERLNLNDNRLTGSIPNNLNTLAKLKVLNLQNNQLTGSIPANLGTLTKLTVLNLNTNQLSGCFPASLTALCGGGRSVDFQNNLGLPGEGDFDAFCSRGFGKAGFVAQASVSLTSACIESVVSLSANGGSGYSYNWLSPAGTTLSSNSDQSVSATMSTSGVKTFTVVISSGSSCSSTATVNVTVNNLSTIRLSASNACAGSPVTLSATSGLSSYTFTGPSGRLSGAGNTRLVLSLTAGTYSFSVAAVNASGCVATDQLSLVVNELPTATLTSSGTLTCDQRTVTLTASGGESYTFTRGGVVLGTPGSTNTIDVTTAGTYTVRVVNATGCVSTTTTSVVSTIATVNVDNPVTTTGIKDVAFSKTFSASGGASPRSFSVASGSLPDGLNLSTTGVLSGTPTESGSFTITVQATDANGCSAVGANYILTITDNTPTITDFGAVNTSVCVGSLLTFTATVGNVSGLYNYTLTNGIGTPTSGVKNSTAFTQNLTSSESGSQSFTLIVSANSQLASATTDVTVSSLPVPSLTNNGPISCTLPAVTLTASGGNSYTFTKSGEVIGAPGSTNTVDVTSAGTYTVRVANVTGCVSTTTTNVANIAAIVTATNPATRNGVVNVSFSQTFSASGGTLPRSFSVASGSLPDGLSLSTTGVLSGTPTESGSFTITVQATDVNGCSGVGASYVLTIIDNTPIISDFGAVNTSLCVGSIATFTATIGNVTGTYNYTLTNGIGTPTSGIKTSAAFSQNLTLAGSGTQSFTLTIRANNQSTSATIDITVSPFPVASLTNNGPLSCTLTTVTLTASGGTSYTFIKSGEVVGTPGSTNTIDVTTLGTYTVRVANATGCVSTTTTTVGNIVATVNVNNPSTTNGVQNVAFSRNFTASGGTAPRSFSVVSGSLPTGLNLSATGVLSGTPTQSGSFSITVRAIDVNGCSGVGASYVLTIVNNTPIIDNFAAVNNAVCVGSPVTFTATISNVTGTYSYTLTNGISTPTTGTKTSATFSQNLTSAGSGSQSFTLIISDNSQSAFATTAVTVSSFPVASLINNGPISCTLPAVTLTASGGTSYTFTRGGTVVGTSGSANTLDVAVAGTYTVRVANESGCASTTTTTVTSNTALPALTVSPTSATLTNANPSTTLTASGTGSPLWSTGQTTPMISVTTSGNYSVTLTGANGCKATANVPVRGSDLTANILLPQAQFGASGTAAVGNFVVNVFEVGGLPTSSGNVTITITAPIGYTLAFPPNLTSIDVQTSGTLNVNNGQWTVTKSLANRQLTLTMNSGAFISGGGESSLGFTLTRTSANSGSTSSITVNVADDLTMTYDGNLANNVYARIISGL